MTATIAIRITVGDGRITVASAAPLDESTTEEERYDFHLTPDMRDDIERSLGMIVNHWLAQI